MNKAYLIIIAALFLGCQSGPQQAAKELTILGTVHFPTEGINADSIYQALLTIQPEVILLERDSSAFDDDFNRLFDDEGNETLAIARFFDTYPNTLIRPIEFEGRDTFRDQTGLYPQANDVYQKLNELSRSGSFNDQEQQFWDRFAYFWVKLDSMASINLRAINTDYSDTILDSAKKYQYTKMKEIVANNDAFKEMMLDSKGDSISMKAYFDKWEQFEHYSRNNAMVDNIIRTMNSMEQQKFVLIVGYHHRYYIKKALKDKAPNILLTEFYE
ncbi:hypothetical protein AB2B38_012345 [Balneola sp. MJW-20]|uniref:hypothetical protein n=1 Tax=Gracilimonas aurantiaca TaxID=3234185 RepID=UPI0034656D37